MATRAFSASLARFAQSGFRASANGPIRRPTQLLQLRRPSAIRSFSAGTAFYAKKYSEEHEWVELDSDGTTGVVGISQYAKNSLGEVVFVEIPERDAEVKQGDVFGSVESTKAASDIMAPVSGKIIEVNDNLLDDPNVMNDSPEGDGWIAKLKVKDLKELDALMDSEKYKKYCEELSDN